MLNNYPQTIIRVEAIRAIRIHAEVSNTISNCLNWAFAVKNALAQQGVDPRRTEAIGYGKKQLISLSDAMNRRFNSVINPIRSELRGNKA